MRPMFTGTFHQGQERAYVETDRLYLLLTATDVPEHMQHEAFNQVASGNDYEWGWWTLKRVR